VDPRRPTRFLRGADDPLPADVVVVDEVSMVDLALMAKLLDAVPTTARLILLGDRDQLASVEAGAILGDICAGDGAERSAAFVERLTSLGCDGGDAPGDGAASGLRDCIVRLTHSHRFRAGSGIGAVARAVNAGDATAALAALRRPGDATLDRRSADDATLHVPPEQARDARAIREVAVAGYRDFLSAATPTEALDRLDRFRVLCAHREGAFGAAGLNEAIAGWLEAAGLLRRGGEGGWYHGRPIIVTENAHQLQLYNGDTGVILEEEGRPRAFFRAADGDGIRSLAPTRLPAHDSVFAMTVHRSQGSEFARVVLVLPSRPSAVLTRELLYTGLTRARESVLVVGSPAVLRAAIAERVQRASGLRERLWGGVADGAAALH
jgi:exodeoxyribonuclease V alpha subunit